MEAKATQLLNEIQITVKSEALPDGKTKLTGKVKDRGSMYEPILIIDKDERIVQGECKCHHYYQNKMFKGPCEHMLALRMAQTKQNWWGKFFAN